MKSAIMNKFNRRTGGLSLAMFMACASMSQMVQADVPEQYNQITFETQSKSVIENDEVVAILSKRIQEKNSKDLASKLNKTINQAMSIAKKYPMVKVITDNQRTEPMYGKNGNIIGWTGVASVRLVSKDMAVTSELIADLQSILVLDNLSFEVSSEKYDAVQKQLMIEASKAFQEQAQSLAKAWNAKGYRLVQVRISPQDYYRPQPVVMFMKTSGNNEESVPSQSLEAGTSTIRVSASGKIQLIP